MRIRRATYIALLAALAVSSATAFELGCGAEADIVSDYVWEERGIEVVEIAKAFRPMVVLGDGVYYEGVEGRFIAREIPSEAALGLALKSAEIRTAGEEEVTSFYLIECDDGWTGWTDSYYDPDPENLGYWGEVMAETLLVRAAPRLEAEPVGQVRKGDVIKFYKRSNDEDTIDGLTGYWYSISDDEPRWIFGGYLFDLLAFALLNTLTDYSPIMYSLPPDIRKPITRLYVNEILDQPRKPYYPYYYNTESYGIRNCSYQSQALYEGCRVFRPYEKVEIDEGSIRQCLEWADRLEKEYWDEVIFPGRGIYGDMPAGAEALGFKIACYYALGDKEEYEAVMIKCYAEYHDVSTYFSTYGEGLISNTVAAAKEWGVDFALHLLDRFLEITPEGNKRVYILYTKGKVKAQDPKRISEAIGLFERVINEYPNAGYPSFYGESFYAHLSMISILELLPDVKAQEYYLKGLLDKEQPHQIRCFAAYVLAKGWPNVADPKGDEIRLYDGDTKYESIYQEYDSEVRRDYWFNNINVP